MNVRDEILKLLAVTNGEFVSGSALAEKLGVSRNAVWKAVKVLENEGYIVESVTSKGYRFSKENTKLCDIAVDCRLNTKFLGRKLVILDEVDSTNNYAKKLASSGAVHGTVVAADKQTGGRGRMGRTFVSPSGKGLYMSVILRPDFGIETAQLITTAAACAAAKAVEKLCSRNVNIKWVNDLYLNGMKICGILTEASLGLEMKSLEYAIVGIGVNVRKVGDSFDETLSKRASSIEDQTGEKISRNQLCAEILNQLEVYMDMLENKSFLDEYRSRELLTGNYITANIGGETVAGKALGIDDSANMILELADGSVKHLSSGEARLCRLNDKGAEI